MSLSFISPRGSIEQRWIVYAMLRDNVQHHLEGGEPTAAFETLHSLSEALGGKIVRASARKLHDELERARTILSKPSSELAVSLRTRSVVTLAWPPPQRRETALLSELGLTSMPMLSTPTVAKTLDDVFGHLLEGLLRLTEGAGPDDVVEVRDV